MAVQYDFYKNPSPKENEGQTCYHARVVPYGTTDTVALAERIHSRCTVTPADVKAVLTSLSDVVIDELKAGNRVHIDGLGYLQITLECPTVQSPKEVRAESIRFKSIAFRPEAELKKRLCTTKFERISAMLASFFATHTYMSRSDFQSLCGYTRPTANRRLKELRESGKLQIVGTRRSSLYVKGEGMGE